MPDPDGVELDGAARRRRCCAPRPTFRRARLAMQRDEIARLGTELALEQWHLPMLPVAGLDAADVGRLLAGGRVRARAQ